MAGHDRSLLEAAIIGYQVEAARITRAIADIGRQLGRAGADGELGTTAAPKKRHRISPEGRARIAEAQRKRWAAAKKK